MKRINPNHIPASWRGLGQWIVWKLCDRHGKTTKVPFNAMSGSEAKSNDPATWTDFVTALTRYESGGWSGLGLMFAPERILCGIDLDACRDKTTGKMQEWAREVILRCNTYAEVSPSENGVKLWLVGKSPSDTGKNIKLPEHGQIDGKAAGVEIYDHGRWFAVTGWRLNGPDEPQPRQEAIDWFFKKFIPKTAAPSVAGENWYGEDSVIERARKYVAKLAPAVSGSAGHSSTFHAACVLVLGFGLSRDSALTVLREYNATCQPPWSERELAHKIDQAAKQAGERNYLRNVPLDKWDGVRLPAYTAPLEPAHSMIHATTLQGAAKKYLDSLREGGGKLIDTGIPNLDFALGGGLEMGELVIVAARPSHGKSAFALQLAHYWTGQGSPAIIVSEEMSAISLGKRAMQYISAVPQEHWPHSLPSLDKDLADYGDSRSECLIVEGCRTAEAACEQISKAVEEKKIKVAIIDYAQLLTAKGQGRYEQVTNTSIAIRQVTNKHSILTIMLCQLNREIEKRKKFTPQNSDLRDSGGLEQDADVILCLVWPHRLDSANLPHYFQIFVHKNRNRPINETQVECHFNPSRQMLLDAKPRSAPPDTPGYEQAFDLPPSTKPTITGFGL